MKKKTIVMSLLACSLLLGACSTSDMESKDSKEADAEVSTEVSNKIEWEGKERVVVDNELIKITFLGYAEAEGLSGKEAAAKFLLENKKDKTLEVEFSNTSIDDLMVNDYEAYYDIMIAGGKKGEFILKLTDTGDSFSEFPKFEKNIGGKVIIYDTNYNIISQFPYSVDLTDGKSTK